MKEGSPQSKTFNKNVNDNKNLIDRTNTCNIRKNQMQRA